MFTSLSDLKFYKLELSTCAVVVTVQSGYKLSFRAAGPFNLMLWSFKVKQANYRGDLSDTHHIFHHLQNDAMEVWEMTFSLCVSGGRDSEVSQMMSWLLGKFVAIKEAIEPNTWCRFQ